MTNEQVNGLKKLVRSYDREVPFMEYGEYAEYCEPELEELANGGDPGQLEEMRRVLVEAIETAYEEGGLGKYYKRYYKRLEEHYTGGDDPSRLEDKEYEKQLEEECWKETDKALAEYWARLVEEIGGDE